MGALLRQIESASEGLRRAERRVAKAVLGEPQTVISASVSSLARRAGVSDPTVLRFCRAVGCEGYRDFKLKLAQDLAVNDAGGGGFGGVVLSPGDSVQAATRKVLGAAIEMLTELRSTLDARAIEQAAWAVARARRIEICGFGASASVAIDAQHKLFRLIANTAAITDPHMQVMAAATLGPEDVLLAISHTGRSRELIETVGVALESGATVIAITQGGSPLARAASIVIPVEVDEDTAVYTPMLSRLAHLAVIDALVVSVSLLSAPAMAARLQRMKQALARRKLPEPEVAGDTCTGGSSA